MPEPIVLHLGRAGEVPGGMTQVINGILNWDFRRCQTVLLRTRSGRSAARDFASWARAVLAIVRCRRERHVVVGHLSQRGSFLREGSLLMLAHCRGLRTVAQLHGSSFANYASRRRLIVRSVLRCTEVVLVLSRETESVARSIVPEKPVRVVPNTVMRGAMSSRKSNSVVFAGLISERKGADVLLKSWSLAALNGWRLILAGPIAPGFVPEPVTDSVDLAGSLSNGQVLDLLDSAKIAILPSRAEAMPVFLLEAMARNVAIVTTGVGGIPELVGDAGLVVRPGDVRELTEAILSLASTEGAVEKWAGLAKQRFEEHFAPEVVYTEMEEHWLDTSEGR